MTLLDHVAYDVASRTASYFMHKKHLMKGPELEALKDAVEVYEGLLFVAQNVRDVQDEHTDAGRIAEQDRHDRIHA